MLFGIHRSTILKLIHMDIWTNLDLIFNILYGKVNPREFSSSQKFYSAYTHIQETFPRLCFYSFPFFRFLFVFLLSFVGSENTELISVSLHFIFFSSLSSFLFLVVVQVLSSPKHCFNPLYEIHSSIYQITHWHIQNRRRRLSTRVHLLNRFIISTFTAFLRCFSYFASFEFSLCLQFSFNNRCVRLKHHIYIYIYTVDYVGECVANVCDSISVWKFDEKLIICLMVFGI